MFADSEAEEEDEVDADMNAEEEEEEAAAEAEADGGGGGEVELRSGWESTRDSTRSLFLSWYACLWRATIRSNATLTHCGKLARMVVLLLSFFVYSTMRLIVGAFVEHIEKFFETRWIVKLCNKQQSGGGMFAHFVGPQSDWAATRRPPLRGRNSQHDKIVLTCMKSPHMAAEEAMTSFV